MQTWFISEGQLVRADARGECRAVDSPFVREAVQRAERSRQLDGWKTAQSEDDRGRMVPRAVLWGAGRSGGGAVTHRFRFITRGCDDTIYYVIAIGNHTGLFRYHLDNDREIRLFHGAAMQCLGLAYDASSDHLLLAAGNADGTACLEMVDKDGRRRGQITGGDAVDAAPSVSAREPGIVYYQSSGVARHAQTGRTAAIGPAALLKLDTRSAKLTTVLEHRDFDYLAPREDRSGNLWFIRRPYEKTASEVAFDAGKSALLFPWRVVKGVFGFLDVFSKIYGREQDNLRTSGGPQTAEFKPDMGALWLHGRMVAINDVRYDTGRGGLVPASWELVCRNHKGQEYVAAKHVVAFDVAGDDVVYSNGFAVFELKDGDWREVTRANLVENVCVA